MATFTIDSASEILANAVGTYSAHQAENRRATLVIAWAMAADVDQALTDKVSALPDSEGRKFYLRTLKAKNRSAMAIAGRGVREDSGTDAKSVKAFRALVKALDSERAVSARKLNAARKSVGVHLDGNASDWAGALALFNAAAPVPKKVEAKIDPATIVESLMAVPVADLPADALAALDAWRTGRTLKVA